jgi:hypothetical protein
MVFWCTAWNNGVINKGESMLTKRLNIPFDMCSMHDPAFDEMEDDKLKSYILTRDIDKLDIEDLPTKPTIFTCRPLQQEYEHLPESAITSSQEVAWKIFKTHVTEVRNFLDDNGKNIIKWKDTSNGTRVVDDSCRSDVPMGIVQEVALVITHKAVKGDYSPFMLPQSYLRDRIRLRLHRAMTAKTEPAKQ